MQIQKLVQPQTPEDLRGRTLVGDGGPCAGDFAAILAAGLAAAELPGFRSCVFRACKNRSEQNRGMYRTGLISTLT